MIRMNHEHACQLTVCSGCRLQAYMLHTTYFFEVFLQFKHKLKAALRKSFRCVWMMLCESGKIGGFVVDLWIVFHRAGAKRVKIGVYAKVPL